MEEESGGILDSLTNYGADALRAVNQGLLMGYGDEAMAGIGAGYEALTSDASFGDAYDRRLGRERSRLKEFQRDNPIAAMGAEVVGALPTAVLAPGGAMMNAARPLAARMGAGAASGAAYGGAYGFGQGQGGAAERIGNMGAPAAIGGAIGAAGPVVARGAGKVAEMIAARKQAKQAGTQTPEASQVMQEFISADMAGAGERLARAGPDAMMADIGPNTRQLLDVAIQTSGPAGTAARQAVNDRVKKASDDITTAMDRTLGSPQGLRTVETDLRKLTGTRVGAAYRDAYSRPIDYSSETGRQIEDIIAKPALRKAIREANTLIDLADDVSVKPLKVKRGEDGKVTFEEMPSVQQLDYVTRGLNQLADREAGKGAMGATTTKGRAYSKAATQLRGLVRQAVPEYDEAVSMAAEPIRARQAFKLGQDALGRKAPDEIADEMAGMTGSERAFVANGVRSAIDDRIGRVQQAFSDPANTDVREAAKALKELSSRGNREKVRTIVGNDAADDLFDTLDRASVAFELKAAVSENSKTYARTALAEAGWRRCR